MILRKKRLILQMCWQGQLSLDNEKACQPLIYVKFPRRYENSFHVSDFPNRNHGEPMAKRRKKEDVEDRKLFEDLPRKLRPSHLEDDGTGIIHLLPIKNRDGLIQRSRAATANPGFYNIISCLYTCISKSSQSFRFSNFSGSKAKKKK